MAYFCIMKVLPFNIPKPNNDALVYQEDIEKVFYDKLHQHIEIQVSCIIQGSGTLIVGDSVNQYHMGDVILIGSNLPHVFKSERSTDESKMLSLFFTMDSFGESFFDLEELNSSSKFFNRSMNGLLAMSHKQKLQDYFLELKESTKLERFIILLKIIEILSKCKAKNLSTFIYDKRYSDIEGNRMRDVFEYTMSNFTNEITLDQISNTAAMTKNAFCKYFKRRTNKTYISFLNELRVEHASKLLKKDEDSSIVDIAEQSGFNNISNFNRQFKAFKNQSPSEFRKNS